MSADSSASLPSKAAKAQARKKSTRRRKVPKVVLHIQSTYNNTLLSATDPTGNLLAWSSAGRLGYTGTKKSTPYAAHAAVQDLLRRLEPFQVKEISVAVKGIGSGRESALRAVVGGSGYVLTAIRDVTPTPHNGPRPPKRRRV